MPLRSITPGYGGHIDVAVASALFMIRTSIGIEKNLSMIHVLKIVFLQYMK